MIGTGAFWTTLAKDIREARKVAVEQLAMGQFGSHVEAMRLVGQVAGFDWVLQRAANILGDNKHPLPTQTADEDDF